MKGFSKMKTDIRGWVKRNPQDIFGIPSSKNWADPKTRVKLTAVQSLSKNTHWLSAALPGEAEDARLLERAFRHPSITKVSPVLAIPCLYLQPI
jgi:hypothetical protein